MNKGESLLETIKTIKMMGVEAVIIRHSDDQLVQELSHKSQLPIINAGSGKTHHPSQALLDLHTIYKEFKDLSSLNIHISGDIKHSRVAASHIQLWEKLKAKICLSGPQELMPESGKVTRKSTQEALNESDVHIFLRVQKERHQNHHIKFESYNQEYGLNLKQLKYIKKKSIIMHPGPFNLGVEITQDVLKDSRCRIYDQVKNSIFMRMAIIDWLIEER